MSSILVVEPEHRYSERIHAALGADGWNIRVVNESALALQMAAAERPDLVLLNADLPGADRVASSLSRSAGGPGVVGLLPETAAGTWIGADDHLSKPFTDQELRQVVQRNARGAAPSSNVMLTSFDIFGDVLAEVEGESPTAAPQPPIPPTPLRAAPAAPSKPAAQFRDDDEINRKLEQTLSGVFGPGALDSRPRPTATTQAVPIVPVKPAPRKTEASADVDALLSKTLSTLELGRPKATVPRPTPPPPPPVAAPAPVQPAREETAVRKRVSAASGALGDFDLAAFNELAWPTGRPEPPKAPPQGPSAAPPAPSVPLPPPTVPEPSAQAFMPEPELVMDPLPKLPEIEEPEIEAIPDFPEIPEWPAPTGRSVAVDAAATQRIQIPPLSVLEESGDQPGERFGQYTLLEKIAAGGMAEVWKARMRGVEGFQKTVAIKKILGHMTGNSEFVSMFIDEAKLAAQLSHPNIVHIYDLGKIGRDYYIAMEFVDGKDLRSLMNAGRRKGIRLPLPLALFIAARLASALDYAHRKRDFEDRDMGLVHRDVSPQNVLLSLEGDVKLCDFGIAKAVSKAGQTQMGALKGKLQYMSPEQAWGRQVDARSDIFSLGSVLFEMLTGERLFSGDTEMSVLESVRHGQIRSTRQIDPSIPVGVDEIVAKALAYDQQNRFANAGEMKLRLESVLHTLGLSPDPTDLAAWVQHVLEEEPSSGDWSVAPAISAIAEAPSRPAFEELPIAESPVRATQPPAHPPQTAFPVHPPHPSDIESRPSVAAVAPIGEVRVGESAPRSRNVLYLAIAALVLVAIVTFLLLLRRSGQQPPASEVATPQRAAPALRTVPPVASPVPATTPAPAGATPVPALSQEQIQKMIEEGTAKQEEEIRRKLDAQERRLRDEIARVQAEARKKKEAAGAAANEGEPTPPPR